ncbi:MAG: hypothetical protein ACM3XO_01935, partial [Bacteroidota bacterium]
FDRMPGREQEDRQHHQQSGKKPENRFFGERSIPKVHEPTIKQNATAWKTILKFQRQEGEAGSPISAHPHYNTSLLDYEYRKPK